MDFNVGLLSKSGGRGSNEDFADYLTIGRFGCFVLADGLGGHRGGEIASKLAVKGILKSFRESSEADKSNLRLHLEESQQAFLKAKSESGKDHNGKTTLVVLFVDLEKYIAKWAHIGDSRLYLFKNHEIIFQTKDHSVPQYLAEIGEISYEEIRFHEDRNRLTAAYDGDSLGRVHFIDDFQNVGSGERYLLCSDGFWEYIYEAEMEKTLRISKSPIDWLTKMENTLLKRVAKDHDNYSAVALFVE